MRFTFVDDVVPLHALVANNERGRVHGVVVVASLGREEQAPVQLRVAQEVDVVLEKSYVARRMEVFVAFSGEEQDRFSGKKRDKNA